MCNYGGGGEERERSGVEEVGEGRGECVCNVMKERKEREEVGEGREERRRGREGEERGGEEVRVEERQREVKEVGEGEEQDRKGGRRGGRESMCKSTEEWEGQNAAGRERRGGGEGQRERS